MLKTIKIKNIKKLGKRPVYNLMVKKTHNFILGNGILTHNTSPAQNSLRNTMEEYSNNVFFILSCNDVSKIIDPIRSRCVELDFSQPPKGEIVDKLLEINKLEKIGIEEDKIVALVERLYPDIRRCIMALQNAKVTGKLDFTDFYGYEQMIKYLETGNIKAIYEEVYSGRLDILGFNRYYFRHTFENMPLISPTMPLILTILSETEKDYSLGINLTLGFVARCFKIIELLKRR